MAINSTLGVVSLGESEHKILLDVGGIASTTAFGIPTSQARIAPTGISSTIVFGSSQITAPSTHITLSWTSPPDVFSSLNYIEGATATLPALEASSSHPPLDVIHYTVLSGGDFPETMSLDRDTGIISGTFTEMNNYVAGWDTQDPTFSNYGTYGSGALYSGNASTKKDLYFTVRAIEDPNSTYNFTNPPYEYYDREFYIPLGNNWSEDAKHMILNLDTQFYVNGVEATNEEYLAYLQSQGYFV